MTRLAVAATLGIAFALAVVSFAAAQGQDVQISKLDCAGDPEIVVVTVTGDAAHDFTGWELRSDPEESEVFSLSLLGTSVGSNTMQSGPSAGGVFSWGTDEVFRDNDHTDYVKLVDDSGATVDQVNCAPEPSPTPEPSPAAEVPNGGGPPAPAADILSPGMMVMIGGSLAAAGLGAIALPWLRLRPSSVAVSPSSRSRSAAGRSDRLGRGSRGSRPGYSTVSLAAVALTALIVFHFLRRRSG